MATEIETDLNQLRSEVTHLRADISRIAETLQSLARHGVAGVADRAHKTADGLQDAVASKAAGLIQEIEEKPVTAAVTSFALGVFLGTLFSGRR